MKHRVITFDGYLVRTSNHKETIDDIVNKYLLEHDCKVLNMSTAAYTEIGTDTGHVVVTLLIEDPRE